jgi:uncharacterized repeat protein (TIGR03803 family)
MRKMVTSLLAVMGLAIVAAAPGQSRPADLTTLVSFCSLPNCTDGANPQAGLIADASGNLFGTTALGGANNQTVVGQGGTVFKIAKTASGYAGTPTVLYSFCSVIMNGICTDGANPQAGLLPDASGNLFSTTILGGVHGAGTVFEIAKTASGYASTPIVLYSFCAIGGMCLDGSFPAAGLIADASGNLFGTTASGGSNFKGTVFEIVKTSDGFASTLSTLVKFNDGSSPQAGLIADANGNLFGTTSGGVNGGGSVFEIAKTASGYASTATVLYSFCGPTLQDCPEGFKPQAGLIIDANGNLFGTTSLGGANSQGTVFEIAKTASGYASTPTVPYSFCAEPNCADGANPNAGVIADASGNLFGTTVLGGANNHTVGGTRLGGTVFEIAKTASGYASTATVLYSFCAEPNCTDGANPQGGLIADASGNLFGTTSGGVNGGGTVFEITGSGFVVPGAPPMFAGTPGKSNCHGQSVSALARQYGGLNGAAAALGYSDVSTLQSAIMTFCEG